MEAPGEAWWYAAAAEEHGAERTDSDRLETTRSAGLGQKGEQRGRWVYAGGGGVHVMR